MEKFGEQGSLADSRDSESHLQATDWKAELNSLYKMDSTMHQIGPFNQEALLMLNGFSLDDKGRTQGGAGGSENNAKAKSGGGGASDKYDRPEAGRSRANKPGRGGGGGSDKYEIN